MQFPEVFIFIMQKIAHATRKLDPKGPWQHMQNYRKPNIKIFSQPIEKTIKKKPNFSHIRSQLDLVNDPRETFKKHSS